MSSRKYTAFGKDSGASFEAGIDWITYIDKSKHAVDRTHAVAEELHAEYGDPCAKEKPFNLCGYRGWLRNSIRIGRRGHGCLLQLSGAVADASWMKLAPLPGRLSRLDLQLTTSLSVSHPSFGRRFLRPSPPTPQRPPSSRPQRGYWRHSNGAFLGTVGERTKCRYLRVYDKGIESNTSPAGMVWRTELEAKAGLASRLWSDLRQSPEPRRWVYDSLAEQWSASGYSWPLAGSSRTVGILSAPSRPLPDAARLRQWLRTSVSPAISRLLSESSPSEIARLLKLHPDDYATGD